jgi:DNA-binding response OmpR family regulator
VATGAAAVAQLQLSPEVVFVDLHLADMHGTELLGKVRESAPSCRVIGLSGAEPEADVVRQFDGFLLKPVALDTLLAAVTGQ